MSNTESLANMRTHKVKIGISPYFICRSNFVSTRTLTFTAEAKCHLGQQWSKSENFANTRAPKVKLGISPYFICRYNLVSKRT